MVSFFVFSILSFFRCVSFVSITSTFVGWAIGIIFDASIQTMNISTVASFPFADGIARWPGKREIFDLKLIEFFDRIDCGWKGFLTGSGTLILGNWVDTVGNSFDTNSTCRAKYENFWSECKPGRCVCENVKWYLSIAFAFNLFLIGRRSNLLTARPTEIRCRRLEHGRQCSTTGMDCFCRQTMAECHLYSMLWPHQHNFWTFLRRQTEKSGNEN